MQENPTGRGQNSRDGAQLRIWLPSQLKSDFAALCRAEGLTKSTAIRRLILAYLRKAANGRD